MKKLLLKAQKKEIFGLMVTAKLAPSMFQWNDIESKFSSDIISKVYYKDSDYFFTFDFIDEKYCCSYSPSTDSPIGEVSHADWVYVLMNHVNPWLHSLKREVEIIDPWGEIEGYLPGDDINLEDEKENSPFTYGQVEHISVALNKLKSEIKNKFSLDDKQFGIVQNKLDYLIDRSKRMGRIDWKNLFVGALMGLAVSLAIPHGKVHILWGLVKICFKGILPLGK